MPGYDVTGWFGILAPARTPKAVLERLNVEVHKAASTQQFRDKVTNVGLDVVGNTPAEMLALHRLNHPNVVKFYDAGVHNGVPWYAAEFVDGTDAAALLKSRPGLNWADDVVRIAVQARTENRQNPWDASSMTGDFFFTPPEAPAPSALTVREEVRAWTREPG